MIEKMKKVYVVSSAQKKDEMLKGLRKLGLLHLSEKKGADRAVTEKYIELSQTINLLADYAPDKKEAKPEKKPLAGDEEFAEIYAAVKEGFEKKDFLTKEINLTVSEIERIAPWGDFSPSEIAELKEDGVELHFYRMGKAELKMLSENEEAPFIKLASVEKSETVAIIGSLPAGVSGTELSLPSVSLSELRTYLAELKEQYETNEYALKELASNDASFKYRLIKAESEIEYSAVGASTEGDDELCWLCGYIPDEEMPSFRSAASENGWAYAEDDIQSDDETVPTKVKYGKVSGLIKPVFDILGILPGYRESDISIWFLLFFALFFAMIIGDGGYGLVILIATILIRVKSKKSSNVTFLLFVLSIATIVWGCVTGTWFAAKGAMNIPLLRMLVIPSFATYPEVFNLTSADSQNGIMKLSFSIGAIQMAIGSLIAIRKKISEKNLSWISDFGWLIAIVAMYMLALQLVIGEAISIPLVFAMVGVAFVIVLLFGGMSPEKTFAQGLKAGLADAFTVFLNTVSCFGNIMSYIRLFAVGMAGVAISQSFNDIAAGMGGPLIIFGAVVVIIGHVLNLVMCFLSVVVHGVRLNVLEFSGQAGMEWAGIAYEPFKENEKLNNN